MDDLLHGHDSTYTHAGCRCDECREDHALVARLYRNGYWGGRDLVHGSVSTYVNNRCRCELCSAAKATYDASRRAQVV